MRFRALLAGVCLVGCAASEESPLERSPVGTTAQSIVNGTRSTSAQDATVMMTENGELLCSASLIAPNLILTARHCVSQLNEEGGPCGVAVSNNSPQNIGISIGVNANAAAPVARGKRLFTLQSPDLCGADIALMELDRDVTGVPIAKVRLTPPSVGDIGTAVGYGDNGFGQVTPGRFQRTGVRILAVGPAQATYQSRQGNIPYQVSAGDYGSTESTCFGDSGGPLFDSAGNVIAVTSSGIDESCVDRPTIWTGLAKNAALVLQAAEAVGHPLDASADDTSSRDDGDDDEEEEEEEEDETPKKKKKKKSSAAPPATSMGCAASALPPTAAAPGLYLLAGAAVIVAARRRRK